MAEGWLVAGATTLAMPTVMVVATVLRAVSISVSPLLTLDPFSEKSITSADNVFTGSADGARIGTNLTNLGSMFTGALGVGVGAVLDTLDIPGGNGGAFLRVPVYVAPSFEVAVEDTRDSIMGFYRQLGQQLEASARESGAREIEQRDVRGRRMQEASFEDVLRDKVIVGTPDMVISRLRTISDELQLDGILAELNCGGQVPREGVMRSLRLLCDEVMPAFS